MRWTLSAAAALLLAPWVGAALAFTLTYVLVVVPFALPFVLVKGRKPTGRHEQPRPKERTIWGYAGRHALAH